MEPYELNLSVAELKTNPNSNTLSSFNLPKGQNTNTLWLCAEPACGQKRGDTDFAQKFTLNFGFN